MKGIERVLVIRFRRVGDAVISSAVCSSLRSSFPYARIDFVLNDEIAPLFVGHLDVDRVIGFSRREIKSVWRFLRRVRRVMREGDYDLIVDLRSTLKSMVFPALSLGTGFRIGWGKWYNWFVYNFRVDKVAEGDEVDRMLSILRPLEGFFDVVYVRDFRLFVGVDEKVAFRGKMELCGVDFNKPIVVCAVATRVWGKLWPVERMAECLLRVVERFDVQLVFNYSDDVERGIALRVEELMGFDRRVFTNVRAGSLRELAAMISVSDFFFGNEGGPRHMSQALGVPSFAIFPPGASKGVWLPNASEWFCGIEAEDVVGADGCEGLSDVDKFDCVSVDAVWDRLKVVMDRVFVTSG